MAENCMCKGVGVLVFPCSGGADVGELADRVARKMAACGQTKMFCLAGIGAHIQGMIESAKQAEKIIAIDGCPVACSRKTLEHAGFKVVSFNLKDMGFEKGKTKIDDESIHKVIRKILNQKIEENISGSSGSCCC